MPRTISSLLAATAALLVVAAPAVAQQQNYDTVQVRAEKVTDRLYVLFGAGGNIALSIGDDGAFIVDDQFAPLNEKIVKAIAALTSKPVRFVVNTHFHGDHSGGNQAFGRAGATIMAQDNVRKRLGEEQVRGNNRTPPAPREAMPIVTFSQDLSMFVNGDSVHAIYVPNAHTDGDALIHYMGSNAIHMGDTFFAARFPYIDLTSGGSVDGIVQSADRALAIARDDTKIIPGHGPISTKADLAEYRRVVAT
ncbi:MAG: MBL fold metallo-hydrolase, partial [Gemmatimonadaceae bacterium]